MNGPATARGSLVLRLVRRLRAAVAVLWHGPMRLNALEQRLAEVQQRLDGMERHFTDWHAQLAELAQAVHGKASTGDLLRETERLRDRLAAIDSRLSVVPAAVPPNSPPGQPSEGPAEQAFYVDLERQFRGTEQEIADRLACYRPWLDGLPSGRIADLGCGRGEWLALLGAWGFDAVGIDSNPLNVDALQANRREVVCADALDWLARQPAHSLAAVTAFHLVEHLPFARLLRLVDDARRALMPGGRLILETPNPENLGVGLCTFWLDPTHRRPLPPDLLEFVVAYSGFQVRAVPRLNPEPNAPSDGADRLGRMLAVGRDYAVIADKPA